MDLWLKILWAGALLMLIVYMYPRAKYWLENGPKAKPGDWSGAVLPLGLVVLFVALLIMAVR